MKNKLLGYNAIEDGTFGLKGHVTPKLLPLGVMEVRGKISEAAFE